MRIFKLKWAVLMAVGVIATQVQAQQQPLSTEQAQANAANRERVLLGGKVSPRQRAEMVKAEKADTSRQAGTDFLTSNKDKPGVVTLPNGVQYRVLQAGAGKKPTQDASIKVRYQGRLVDGASFEGNGAGKPVDLRVAGMVAGLRDAVTRMPVGSKWQVVVPPELGYGAMGNHAVPGNAVLIYDIEVVGLI
jgi:FKBP-type peptidyl-prolyl cis-trans isomerase